MKQSVFFVIGGAGYVILELLWRRRSHISMFAAGGSCFLLLGKLGKCHMPWALKAAAGAAGITAAELATGLLVNREYRVWDYRQERGNFLGQICPKFTLLWIPLSAGAMMLHKGLDRLWEK